MTSSPDGQVETIEERFERFDAAHPDVYRLFRRYTLEALAAGNVRIGARMVWERLRWDHKVGQAGAGDYRLNDHFIAHYARRFLREHPERGAVFETRELRARARPRARDPMGSHGSASPSRPQPSPPRIAPPRAEDRIGILESVERLEGGGFQVRATLDRAKTDSLFGPEADKDPRLAWD